ncbi:MAG: hypothetical protein HY791_14160 [Deltaproteobacteria bacterium]|nr:hypothetical protein [Deltaproteobacteria bacterium]
MKTTINTLKQLLCAGTAGLLIACGGIEGGEINETSDELVTTQTNTPSRTTSPTQTSPTQTSPTQTSATQTSPMQTSPTQTSATVDSSQTSPNTSGAQATVSSYPCICQNTGEAAQGYVDASSAADAWNKCESICRPHGGVSGVSLSAANQTSRDSVGGLLPEGDSLVPSEDASPVDAGGSALGEPAILSNCTHLCECGSTGHGVYPLCVNAINGNDAWAKCDAKCLAWEYGSTTGTKVW